MKSISIVTSSVSALLVGILFAIQLSAQDRAKPKTATPSDSAGVGITKDQADGILEELRQIRQLLEKQQAQLDRAVTPQPSLPGAPQKVQMSVKSTWRSLGRADAPITLVEFADYECPFCKGFHTSTYAELKKNYIDTGKVRFVTRDLPLEFHPTASSAAEAVRCAGDQDKYWQLRDALLTNPSAPNDAVIKKAAESLSIEMKAFQACLDSNKYKGDVQEDAAEAATLHLDGTPSFVLGSTLGDKLDGIVLAGAQPYASFDSAIQDMLALQEMLAIQEKLKGLRQTAIQFRDDHIGYPTRLGRSVSQPVVGRSPVASPGTPTAPPGAPVPNLMSPTAPATPPLPTTPQ